MSECPKYDPKTGRQTCLSCGCETLDETEGVGEDMLQYCGPSCSNCGWSHCGGCI